MAENKEKKETNKQVNNNKPNLSTIKNSWKTLGWTLCFRADNSPALPHPHPQIHVMSGPTKKTQHSTFPKRIEVRCNVVWTVTSTTKAIVVREPSVSVWLSSLFKRAKSLRPQKNWHARLSKQQNQTIYLKYVRIFATLKPFLLLIEILSLIERWYILSWLLALIKFLEISFSLVGVGGGGAEKPASRLKKRLLRFQTKGGKILPRG